MADRDFISSGNMSLDRPYNISTVVIDRYQSHHDALQKSFCWQLLVHKWSNSKLRNVEVNPLSELQNNLQLKKAHDAAFNRFYEESNSSEILQHNSQTHFGRTRELPKMLKSFSVQIYLREGVNQTSLSTKLHDLRRNYLLDTTKLPLTCFCLLHGYLDEEICRR